MISADEGLLRSLTPGTLKGQGVFETTRIYRGEIFAWGEHYARLCRGLETLRLKSPYSAKKISGIIKETLDFNELNNARVRVVIWKENKVLRNAVICQPLSPQAKRFKAGVSTIQHPKRSTAHLKSIDYGIFQQALKQAEAWGYDEAILLNKRGELVEGARTNIFLVKDQALYTPPLLSGCLAGITRKIILSLSRDKRIITKELPLYREQLQDSDEAFLTNSILEVMPLTEVDREQIGSGKIGPLTKILSQMYRGLVKA